MKIGKSGVQIDNPESLIQRLTSATRCADWEAVTAIALCGIYGELVKLNKSEKAVGTDA